MSRIFEVFINEMNKAMASELTFSERFYWNGALWQHCGGCTTFWDIAAFCLATGEKHVIPYNTEVTRFQEEFWDGLGI